MKLLLVLIAILCSVQVYPKGGGFVSPNEYGLEMAGSGMERYFVLRKTHLAALSKGCDVSYKGIESIDIEIPKDARPIPLTDNTDFAGVTIKVTNNSKDVFLFERKGQSVGKINLEKRNIDNGDFSGNPILKKGRLIVSIQDDSLWVDNRIGYSYGLTRKDILLVENGRAVNSVVMPYDNPQSRPSCIYYIANDKPIVIKHLTLDRVASSKAKTFLVEILGCDNVVLEDITTNTVADGRLAEDRIFRISDCTNVTLRSVRINGTYSRDNFYGYGISLENVWNFQADSLYADGRWGVFGTKCVNRVLIRNSDINRFDIHCYGRDVRFENSVFRRLYNKYSSVYGEISYHKCHFVDFMPYSVDGSYNAYVPNDLTFEDCVWDVTSTHHGLLSVGYLDDRMNKRPELAQKCLPNVRIHNLRLNMDDCVKRVVMFSVKKGEVSQNYTVGYISEIEVSGIVIDNKPEKCRFREFVLSNAKVTTTSKVTITVGDENSQVEDVISPDFKIPWRDMSGGF